jgi:hypothetical protein
MSFEDSGTFLDQESLLSAEQKQEHEASPNPPTKHKWRQLLPYSVGLNIALILIMASAWLVSLRKGKQAYIPNEIFCEFSQPHKGSRYAETIVAPAQSAVEYKTVVFNGGLRGDKTEYQGSSDEVNSKWEDLYNGTPTCQLTLSWHPCANIKPGQKLACHR